MVVGNPRLSFTSKRWTSTISSRPCQGAPQPVQWTCPRSNTNTPLYPPNSDGLHGVGIGDPNNKGAGVGFPDQNCDGYASPLRADIHFPSCYDPSNGLDSYKNNMQFPSSAGASARWQSQLPTWLDPHSPSLLRSLLEHSYCSRTDGPPVKAHSHSFSQMEIPPATLCMVTS